MHKMKKKAQEEIVGFVAIVVIVAVIFVVFLGISARQDVPELKKESKDIRNFLDGSMQYTSDCALNYEPDYSSVAELLKACYAKKKCINGKEACVELNRTMKEITETSWKAWKDSPIKAYKFEAHYSLNNSEKTTNIITISKGECGNIARKADNFIDSYPGIIKYSFQLCY